MISRSLFLALAVLVAAVFARPTAAVAGGLHGATVLIIRHAEKPDEGEGLTPAGEARARAYATYFRDYKVHGEPLRLDAIFAAADSKGSRRPRLTVEPTAQAFGLRINASYPDKDFQALATELQTHHDGKNILICWHHGKIAELLQALGADPATLLPGGHWPGDEYDWLIELHYDHDGNLKEARRVDEGLTAPK